MMNLIFYSAEKFVHTPKKLPLTMRSVLLVLAGGSILIGFLGLPHFLGLKNLFSSYFHSAGRITHLFLSLGGAAFGFWFF